MLSTRTQLSHKLLKPIRTLTTSVSPSLLAHSRRQVDLANSKRSDELGDIMAKRWLGSAGIKGNDTDRVSLISVICQECYLIWIEKNEGEILLYITNVVFSTISPHFIPVLNFKFYSTTFNTTPLTTRIHCSTIIRIQSLDYSTL